MIGSGFDDRDFLRVLNNIAALGVNASPLMGALSEDMHAEVMDNFDAEGRPAWMGLKPGTIAARTKRGHWPGKILTETGRLRGSIQADSGMTWARVGTNEPYARIHQLGGKTRPHVIKPRNKKALAFGGRVVKSVNHPGSEIPARPYMVIAEGGRARMLRTVSDFLRKLAAD
jgi:phage virion morphogenesis protein